MIRLIWSAIMKWGWDYNRNLRNRDSIELAVRPLGSVDVEGLTFNVMSAQGGTIVQIRTYDRKADQTCTVTHVIPEGNDTATAIGHIVSMELLRS
jgi:hypothetical protein